MKEILPVPVALAKKAVSEGRLNQGQYEAFKSAYNNFYRVNNEGFPRYPKDHKNLGELETDLLNNTVILLGLQHELGASNEFVRNVATKVYQMQMELNNRKIDLGRRSIKIEKRKDPEQWNKEFIELCENNIQNLETNKAEFKQEMKKLYGFEF